MSLNSGRLRSALDLLSVLLLIIAAGAVIWRMVLHPVEVSTAKGTAPRPSVVSKPQAPIAIASSTLEGSPNAPVGIVEFSEFQCPYCYRFATETLPALREKYVKSGQLALSFRHLPLDAIHPFAKTAALLASCAGEKGAFWKVHDAFFSEPRPQSGLEFRVRAISVTGFSGAEIEKCTSAEEVAQAVTSDAKLAASLGVHSTPLFFVGTMARGSLQVTGVIQGAKPITEFEVEIGKAQATR